MSTERRRRRAERERLKAAAAVKRQRREVRVRRRSERMARLRAVLPRMPRRMRWSRQTGRLATRRRRRYAGVAVLFAALQVVTWLLSPDVYLRVGVLLVSLLVMPVVAHLAVPRRRI